MTDTIIHCARCGARCKVDGLRNLDAKMLRRSKEPKGFCVNCAVHDWLRNTYPVNILLAQSGPKILVYPHIREQFAEIMRIGCADAKPDEINWNLINENWDLPFPQKVKPSAANPCSQQELDEIASGKRPGLGSAGRSMTLTEAAKKMTISSFEELNEIKPGLGDQLKTALDRENVMAKKSAKRNKEERAEAEGEQMDLIDVAPENAKAIIAEARLYKRAQTARLQALEEEVKHKEKVLRLVKEANLQPLEGGKIKFKHGGFIFSITPRDELIKITEEKKGKKSKAKGMKQTVESDELEFEKVKDDSKEE